LFAISNNDRRSDDARFVDLGCRSLAGGMQRRSYQEQHECASGTAAGGFTNTNAWAAIRSGRTASRSAPQESYPHRFRIYAAQREGGMVKAN
jgi:hypothetical protein